MGSTLRAHWGVLKGSTLGVPWECPGSTLGVLWEYSRSALGVLWECSGGYSGSTLGVLWEYSGSTLGVLWEYSGNSLGVLWGYSGDSHPPTAHPVVPPSCHLLCRALFSSKTTSDRTFRIRTPHHQPHRPGEKKAVGVNPLGDFR